MKKICIVSAFLLLAILCGCSHSPHHHGELSKIEENVEVIPGFKANKYSDIYFSAQPPIESFQSLKEAGFASIVNLRQPKEEKYDSKSEEDMAQKLGFNYVNIPVSATDSLTDDKVAEITSAVVEHRKAGKTLIHCSSGNRVALWAGAHFYKDHGVSKTDALKIAKKLGLTKEAPTQKLKEYLGN